MNFKGLPYKTEWIDRIDIEPRSIELGIAPTGKKPDGSPFYTLPAIHDSKTGKYVSDSWNIALYLDETYPDTPTVIPKDTVSLQLAFTDSYPDTGIRAALNPFVIPRLGAHITPRGSEDFVESVERRFGKKLQDIVPQGEAAVAQWTKYKDCLAKVDSWYAASASTFLLGGSMPTWADFVVVAYFMWVRVALGEESEQWKDVTSWHEGRWKRLVDSLRRYETIN